MIRLFLVLAATVFAVAAEPSAFKAGNLDSKNPYGLSDQEKAIYNNKQSIQNQEKQLFTINQQLDRLTKMLDGMSETVRSNSVAIRDLTLKMGSFEERIKGLEEREKKDQTDIEELFKQNEEFRKQTNDGFAKQTQNQKKLLDEQKIIQKNLDITKKDYESVIAQLTDEIEKNRKAIFALGGKIDTKAKEPTKSKKTDDELLNETKKQIEARNYSEAKKLASDLIARKAYEAEAHFYLGSAYYFQNDNKKAISEFKESAKLDENAKHMPILLFYTAIAFERDKNSAEAKKFFEAVVRLYPDHQIVDSAKKRLEKLN